MLLTNDSKEEVIDQSIIFVCFSSVINYKAAARTHEFSLSFFFGCSLSNPLFGRGKAP